MIAINYSVCTDKDESNTVECWNCEGEGFMKDTDGWQHKCLFCHATGKMVMLEDASVIKALLGEIEALKARIEKLEGADSN